MNRKPDKKIYAGVVAYFFKDGTVKPTAVDLGDGQLYRIKKVTETVRAACPEYGGDGIRFRCLLGQTEIYLYYEDPRWFITSTEKR